MGYRNISNEEIAALIDQGCFAQKWADISVNEGFSANNIQNTRFAGKVKLGNQTDTIVVDGISKTCGIYNSDIQDSEIADNVYISEAKSIVNYIIEESVSIQNVGSLVVNGESSFGNGTEIEVFNEGGGRELPIFDKLSSQIAYLTVTYRHDEKLIEKLLALIQTYVDTKKSKQGRVETGTSIQNSLTIKNVNIGSFANVTGVSVLEDGTINSCKEAPTKIGEGVIAKKFIVLSGSKVDSGVIIDKSFIGQSCKIGKQFSAENSTFFANSEGFHGEACSLFAGPYTVTHHKSTLMIACLCSFFNAGSGTNQSNHMYKLGPLHQGILERGSKTGSFSYLLWPCRVGAYTAVMGKHGSNFDTSDFPFSYITEDKGKSTLTPAMNLFTVGTRRDTVKWPDRDGRTDNEKLDLLHFDLFSPYIMGRVLSGISILNELYENASKTQEYVKHKGIQIPRLLLKTTRKYYEMALKVYLGQEIIKSIGDIDGKSSLSDLQKKFVPQSNEGEGEWVDILGMVAPVSKMDELIDAVKSGKINSIEKLNDQLQSIYNNYDKYAWAWYAKLINQHTGSSIDNITSETLVQIITDWKTNSVKLNNMILKDAEKEFDSNSAISFGIDGNEEIQTKDFSAVRGTFEANKFTIGLKKESEEIEAKADKLLAILEKLS